MPVSREWTVRVVNVIPDPVGAPQPHRDQRVLSGLWVEQLRYLGVVRILSTKHREHEERQVLEISYPGATRGINTEGWARSNAARMVSFGITATAAPKWPLHENYTEAANV